MLLPWNEIGGGFVSRSFESGGVRLRVGQELSADDIKAFANAKTLVRAGFLRTYPPKGNVDTAGATKATRHAIHTGGGRYIVVSGVLMHDGVLTKDEAEALAARSD